MKYTIRVNLCTLLLFTCFFRPRAQAGENTPRIGLRAPEFTFHDIRNYAVKQASLRDFAGKNLILDFWSVHCKSCLKSFPGTDSLQKLFGSDVQFILVGYNGEESKDNIENMYKFYEKKYHLNLVTVFDSAAFEQFGIRGVPALVWIDKTGIVRAVSSNSELTGRNMKDFIAGNKMHFELADSAHMAETRKYPYHWNEPLLVNGNGGNDSVFLYRSILSKWTEQIYDAIPPKISLVLHRGERDLFQANGATLNQLYKLAYSGASSYSPRDSLYTVFYPNLILELTDPAPFDLRARDNPIYCYSFIFPAVKYDPAFIQQTLQKDLQTYFGYRVSVETRIMPYWKLTCGPEARVKLRTKGLPVDSTDREDRPGWRINNWPMRLLLYGLWGYFPLEPAFIDETGIDFNIDMTLDGVMTDFDTVKKELARNGLILTKGERPTKVIILRDGDKNASPYNGSKL